jgi:WhiB family transcriptional regulator, redox-sensing transcriptional regulator
VPDGRHLAVSGTFFLNLSKCFDLSIGFPYDVWMTFERIPPTLAPSVVDATWNNREWREAAACGAVDTDIFFPNGLTGHAIDQTKLAKTLCNDCRVRRQCLEFALRTNQDHGVWGGATEEERRVIRRQRRAAARRAVAEQSRAS